MSNPLNCNRRLKKAGYPNYLCHSASHKWVNINTPTGQLIASEIKNNPRACPKTNVKSNKDDYLCNPATAHWVKREGRVGRLVQKHYLHEIPHDISKQSPALVDKPLSPIKEVDYSLENSPIITPKIPSPIVSPIVASPVVPAPIVPVTKPLNSKQSLLALKKTSKSTYPENLKFKMPPGYEYINLINSGLSGLIFLAIRSSDNSFVVIKRYKDEIKPNVAIEMETAVTKLSKIVSDDNYLLHYISSYYDAGNFYLVMDYFNGHNISQLDIKQMTNDDKSQIILQLILGVYDLHIEHHISHGDIKPSSVLINNSHEIKYIGYGLVFDQTSWKKNYNLTSGAPYYRSPENIQMGPHMNLDDQSILQASDIWSLGCMIYFVLTGRHAFQKATEYNIESINYNILAGNPDYSQLPLEFSKNSAFMGIFKKMFIINYLERPKIEEITAQYERAMQAGF